MYSFSTLLAGALISLMMLINGELTSYYGLFFATVIIHFVGSLFAFILLKLRKEKAFSRGLPLWLYLGGAIGAFTVYFNNFAVGKISLTSIVALGLFGQTMTSLIIDLGGLFGMKKYPLQKSTFVGLIFSCFGVWIMLDNLSVAQIFSVVFSLGAGVTIVLSRSVNASLAKRSGALTGSFVNHLVGLVVTCAMLFLFGKQEFASNPGLISNSPWIYLGGTFGVIIVLMFNLLVPKLTSLKVTLLTFVGQVFAGIIIDLLLEQAFSKVTFFGGLIIASGILFNLSLELLQKKT